jgi:hypothetical protein
MSRVLSRVTLAVALVSLCLAAVAETSQEGQPMVRVLSPAQDAQVAGPDVEVRMEVEGVTLSPRRSRMGAYILLRLDNAPPVKTFTDNFTYKGVTAGNHTLRVELRRNDDTSFDPPVRTQVRFSVRAPAQ